MRTLRSRGIDMSASAFFDASRRIRIIVSERRPALASRAPFARLSEPIKSTVWGLPGGAFARIPGGSRTFPWKADEMRSTWWMPATTVETPHAITTKSAPTRERFQIPRRWGSSPSGNAQVCGAEPLRDRVHELDQREAVALERRDRAPLPRDVRPPA